MFDFSAYINLPMVWGGLIATAIFLYVVLDGFDLGVGILFPFAPSDDCRSSMMNSVAPFWDGNETWLVLGGGGLFALFPLAYAILMPALYMPVILMLLGLIFRGVAFEFRFKAEGKGRKVWDNVFHVGSLMAVFFQGVILGAIIQGIKVDGRVFSGTSVDCLSAFSIMTGVALIFGYALLGATWLIMKTDGQTQSWARKSSAYVLIYVLLFIGLVSVWVPFVNEQIMTRWFSMPNMLYLAPIPLLTLVIALKLWQSLDTNREVQPFIFSVLLFLLSYVGLIISLWPWVVPYKISFAQAAAIPESQSLLLVGIIIMLPVVLGYTGYCYYVFRGKSSHQPLY
jgi:cytochrome d ubiquinol oxidase subunit II